MAASRSATSCRQFLQLMWKTWLLRKRHYVVTAFEVLLPLIFCVIAVTIATLAEYGRYDKTREKRQPAEKFQPFDPIYSFQDKIYYWAKPVVAYAPDSPLTGHLMDRVLSKFGWQRSNINFTAYDSEEDLVLNFIKTDYIHPYHYNSYTIGIVFTNIGRDDTKLPERLQYKLRPYGGKMNTDAKYSNAELAGPRSGDVYNTSFWAYQAAVDLAFIEMVQEERNITPRRDVEVKLHRFPYPPYIGGVLYGIADILSHLVVFGLVVLFPVVVKRIVDEKANGAKEMMKMMGMSDWVYWGSSFTSNMILASVIMAIITMLFKIPLRYGVALLANTDGLIFFVTLLLYSAASLLFCFFISTFFTRPVIAVIAVVALWTGHHVLLMSLVYLPILGESLLLLSVAKKVGVCLLPNGALQMAIRIISVLENYNIGAQWNNMSDDTTLGFNLGMVWGSMLLSCVLYSIGIWYVSEAWPWQYGIPKPFYFPFTKSYWFGPQQQEGGDYLELHENKHSQHIEEDAVGVTPGIVISRLTKVFRNTTAVDDVSLNVLDGQITVLLGHNGAGKTTTLNLITGLYPPTKGTISINGYDVVKETKLARRSLGLCPQHNVLYDTLTVEEHLKFFAGLKGVSWSQLDSEVNYILNRLQLQDKKTEISKQLSGGMKRKLCLGVAVIGGSEVLVLDEPTAGMDPEARRNAWDLLQHIRDNRTIFLTTHYMEEADVLGNRIAIMFNGVIQCCGSPIFLKRKFGSGYHLRIIKAEESVVPRITEIVEKHVPEAKLERDVNKELIYSLVSGSSATFGQLFEELESSKKMLGIEACGVTVTTMEDVFLNVGQVPSEQLVNGQDDFSNSAAKIDKDGILLPMASCKVQGVRRYLQQIKGLFLKRFHYTKRHWILIVPHIILPCVVISLLLWLAGSHFRYYIVYESPPLLLDLPSIFGSSTGFYKYSGGEEAEVFVNDYYREQLKTVGVSASDKGNITKYLLTTAEDSLVTYITKFFVGGTVTENSNGTLSVEAWYNGEPFHVGAISLNLMDTSILQYVTKNKKASIEVTNEPIITKSYTMYNSYSLAALNNYLCAFFIPIVVAFMSGAFTLFPVQERVSKAKLLQRMSGVHSITLWLSSFVWDMLLHSLCCVLFIPIPFAIFDIWNDAIGQPQIMGGMLLAFVMFGWCCIPFSYLVSNRVKQPSTGFALLSIISIVAGSILMVSTVAYVQSYFIDFYNAESYFLLAFFHLIPSMAVSRGVGLLFSISKENTFCSNVGDAILQEICPAVSEKELVATCCKEKCGDNCFEKIYPFNMSLDGPGFSLILMFAYGILYFAILCLVETSVTRKFLHFVKTAIQNAVRSNLPFPTTAGSEDNDVIDEEQRVRDIRSQGRSRDEALLVLGLSKEFGLCKTFRAVNQLTFAVHKEECFGLLGVNGAGKTTTFRMLTGDLQITSGTAVIEQHSVQDNLHTFQSFIGYCPQYDALLDRLTGEETLYLFARIRGVPEEEIATSVRQLIEAVHLQEHAAKQTTTYSGGTKRKLSLAIALIGAPPIVFLDEPSAGVDPVAKRKIWSALLRAREVNGSSIVLTSHSMEECEALCNRIGIMVNGRFQCLGTLDHLKAKFGQGFSIVAKLQREQGLDANVDLLKKFIEESFPSAVLKDAHQGTVYYHVTDTTVPWSRLFSKMEQAKSTFPLEDYLISGTSLEQIFLSFARQQKPGRNEDPVLV